MFLEKFKFDEMIKFLWKPMFQQRVQIRPHFETILSHFDPVNMPTHYFHLNIIFPLKPMSQMVSYLGGFQIKVFYSFLIS